MNEHRKLFEFQKLHEKTIQVTVDNSYRFSHGPIVRVMWWTAGCSYWTRGCSGCASPLGSMCIYTCSYHTCSMYILNLIVCWSCSYSCSPIILFTKMLCECCVSRILQLKCDAYLTFEFYVVDAGADSNGRGMVWSAWKEWEFSDGKRRQDISLDPHALFLIFPVLALYLSGTFHTFFLSSRFIPTNPIRAGLIKSLLSCPPLYYVTLVAYLHISKDSNYCRLSF